MFQKIIMHFCLLKKLVDVTFKIINEWLASMLNNTVAQLHLKVACCQQNVLYILQYWEK